MTDFVSFVQWYAKAIGLWCPTICMPHWPSNYRYITHKLGYIMCWDEIVFS